MTPAAALRDATRDDLSDILELNRAAVRQTSPLDHAGLSAIHDLAAYHRVAVIDGRVVAVLIALRQGAAYANQNFAWFAARYADFLYIDRIIVAQPQHGLGIGRHLYRDLAAYAARIGAGRLTCEYALQPLNQPSACFHRALGFAEVGQQRVAQGTKLVSLQARELASDRR